jgi:hypothetical protein
MWFGRPYSGTLNQARDVFFVPTESVVTLAASGHDRKIGRVRLVQENFGWQVVSSAFCAPALGTPRMLPFVRKRP